MRYMFVSIADETDKVSGIVDNFETSLDALISFNTFTQENHKARNYSFFEDDTRRPPKFVECGFNVELLF